jgi:hypothetical protein
MMMTMMTHLVFSLQACQGVLCCGQLVAQLLSPGLTHCAL